MQVKCPKGMYTMKYDEGRKIIYETPVGFWTKEDYQRYANDYVSKLGPVVKGKTWATLTDLRNYKTSDISDEINKHAEWMKNSGCTTAAVIVSSAIVKMQINRLGSNHFQQQAFTDEKEADAWLKGQGF